MKALVLCGGRGARLKPLTHTMAKPMIPVANRPVLSYVLEQIRETEIQDIGIVVSPDNGGYIKEIIGNGSREEESITYITQPKPKGLADAVRVSRDFLGDSPFLLFLGDNLVEGGIKGFVEEFRNSAPDAFILLKEVADPRPFGVAILSKSGRIIKLIEKPARTRSKLAVVGIYIFTPNIHQVIDRIKPSKRGELEITDAIQGLIEEGRVIRSHILEGWWLDTGKKDDLLEANRVVMDSYLRPSVKGIVDTVSQIMGRVEIGEGTVIENSNIRGPVSIASECRITDSSIGPFTSIGQGTQVEKCSLEYSVILEFCHLTNIRHLRDSVIGRNTKVIQYDQGEPGKKLFIGDDAIVEL